ncbi:MAG: thermonuclease family protein [Phycisphaerales bacterium]|nr:thermonuclease family protein [Phycisphaerales bacterium]
MSLTLDTPDASVGRGGAAARPAVRVTWRYYLHRPVARALLIVALLALGSAVYRRLSGRGTPDDLTRYHDRTFAVVHILDGDTFDVNARDGEHAATRVRLWGVDTPEVEGSRDGAMHFGAEASAFTRSALAGRTVRLVLDSERTRDLYGRLLAYAYLDDDPISLNEKLIDGGLAYADLRFDHAYRARFEALEKHARKSNAGLWKDVQPEQMPAWRQRIEASRR